MKSRPFPPTNEAIENAPALLMSAATLLETKMVLFARYGGAGANALDAFRRFGRGTGHAAHLNCGDCFSYALARENAAPLLFKGGDFGHTDVEKAL